MHSGEEGRTVNQRSHLLQTEWENSRDERQNVVAPRMRWESGKRQKPIYGLEKPTKHCGANPS